MARPNKPEPTKAAAPGTKASPAKAAAAAGAKAPAPTREAADSRTGGKAAAAKTPAKTPAKAAAKSAGSAAGSAKPAKTPTAKAAPTPAKAAPTPAKAAPTPAKAAPGAQKASKTTAAKKVVHEAEAEATKPTAAKAAPAPVPPKKAPAKVPAAKVPAPAASAAKAKPAPLDAKFLEEQRSLLLQERATYVGQAEALRAEAEALAQDMEPGDIQFDDEGGEGGTTNIDRERDLALSAQARAEVEEIDAALARIDAGTYGICERCGEAIPRARLKALPQARLGVDCKSGGLSRR